MKIQKRKKESDTNKIPALKIIILLALICIVFSAAPGAANAQKGEAGYYIKSYDIKEIIFGKNVSDVSETIDVYFTGTGSAINIEVPVNSLL
jgi:hypothetical protein